jgi:putative ABC transport system ATP-binding protein
VITLSENKVILTFENVSFGYKDGNKKLEILKDANVSFEDGTFYSIIGPSGSGKTTTLALAGALDSPQKGKILYQGKDIRKIGLTKYRRDTVSMVFQSYNLISYMTALENVIMVMEISRTHKKDRKKSALEILVKLGLTREEAKRNVRRLSGGQQQRVAIARAFASEAKIILADEPTGNLDTQTAEDIVALLKELATSYGKCVIVVTHSEEVSLQADKVMKFARGGMQPIAI